jgi:autotransporter-associated beta strand protein
MKQKGALRRTLVMALATAFLAPAAPAISATTNWAVPSGDFSVGSNWGAGIAPQTGDTVTISNSGTSVLSTAYSATSAAVWLGNGHATGGTLMVASGGSLNTAAMVLGQSGGRGVLLLDGGTLAAPSIVNGSSGVGILYFDGGTLEAAASSSQFLSALSAAYLRAGGAIIDTNGYNETITQPLNRDPSLPKTSPDGGLLKTGAGKLTLAAGDSFTGGTTVLQGTLVINTSTSLADGTRLTVGNGLFAMGPDVAVNDLPNAAGASTLPAATAVPEPRAVLLLAVGFLIAELWIGSARHGQRSDRPYTGIPGISC